MSNPYQPFFDKLDKVLADDSLAAEPRDLLERAGFVLGNLINAQSQVYPILFLPTGEPAPAPNDADTPPLGQPDTPESVAQDDL